MDVLEAVKTRRSIGKLGGDVSDAEVRALVEAAVFAPNHKLTFPWRFIALRGEARARLGQAWAAAAAEAAPGGAERETFLAREAAKPLRAPIVLVVSTRTDQNSVRAIEDFAATAAAVQNILLAAHALGIAAIWRTGDMAYNREINEHLGLDRDDRIVAFVYLGRAAMEAPKGAPRDTEQVLTILE
jgi:nitroreductase